MAFGTVAGVLARIPGLRANAISTPDTDQIGVRGTARFDIVNHDVGDTTNAGPIVALCGGAS